MVRQLVAEVYERVMAHYIKIPYAIRLILRLIVVQSRSHANSVLGSANKKLILTDNDVPMLAEFLCSGWLNSGFRNPRAFGLPVPSEADLHFELVFF